MLVRIWYILRMIQKRSRRRLPYRELYSYEIRKGTGNPDKTIKANARCFGFGPNVKLSHHVNFNGCTIHGSGEVFIGRYFHSGSDLMIFTSDHNYKGASAIPYDKVRIKSKVTIGDFVWAGYHVTIMPGINIGEGAILAAGAVITKNVPPMAIVGGNPAKVIGYRNEDEFNRLKGKEKYL